MQEVVCEVEGCARPVNRDGVCLPHKLKSVHWNGGVRLRNEREVNMTQGEMAKEIFADAKADGTDIRQVNGRRTATQRFVNGKWV